MIIALKLRLQASYKDRISKFWVDGADLVTNMSMDPNAIYFYASNLSLSNMLSIFSRRIW